MHTLSYNTYRSISPEQTYENIKPLFRELGITRVANITGLDEIGIPVYIAVRPNSRSLSLAQGKGLTPLNAKLSAIMETVESYHAENPLIDVLFSSVNELKKRNYPICDYKNLPSLTADSFNEDCKIFWTLGKNLLNENFLYVPFEAVHTDMRVEACLPSPYFIKTSNGLASGNTSQEAINHATYELAERDSYSCWTLLPSEKRAQTKIDLSTVNNNVCRALIEKFSQADAYVGVWNLTSDIGLPAFLVRVVPKEQPPLCNIAPASGFGCHPDKNLALIRALTEAAQSRLTFISGARDDIRLSHYRTYTSKEEYNKWYQSVYKQESTSSFQSIPIHTPDDTKDVWDLLKAKLIQAGIKEIISVDLSRPGFPISVQKVLIPGLEGSEPYSCMRMGSRAIRMQSALNKEIEYA